MDTNRNNNNDKNNDKVNDHQFKHFTDSYAHNKFINNIMKKKCDLFFKSNFNNIHVQSPEQNFYFNHSLKKVNYINNLLVYIHFIVFKYITLYSINEWNVLLFKDIDAYNVCGINNDQSLNKTSASIVSPDSMGDVNNVIEDDNKSDHPISNSNNNNNNNDDDDVDDHVNKDDNNGEGAISPQINDQNCLEQNNSTCEIAMMCNFHLDDYKIEKLNPLNMNENNTIDINYYEYVIEPFDFLFYDQVYNEIYNYLQMLKNQSLFQNDESNNNNNNFSGYNNSGDDNSQYMRQLPFQYYEFMEILTKEVINVRDLIYRNKYVRYLFYYIYRNNKNNLLEGINKIFFFRKE